MAVMSTPRASSIGDIATMTKGYPGDLNPTAGPTSDRRNSRWLRTGVASSAPARRFCQRSSLWSTDETTVTRRPVSDEPDDPVPLGLVLGLDEAFRVFEALEDGLHELVSASLALGLRDELITVIRLIHHRLGSDEGGVS